MPTQPSSGDRRAFVVTTALAVAVVVVVWVLGLRATVARGVAGARETLSSVADTAGSVREQAQPDLEAISAAKAGFQQMIADEQDAEEARGAAIDAVAGIMADQISGTDAASDSEELAESSEPTKEEALAE